MTINTTNGEKACSIINLSFKTFLCETAVNTVDLQNFNWIFHMSRTPGHPHIHLTKNYKLLVQLTLFYLCTPTYVSLHLPFHFRETTSAVLTALHAQEGLTPRGCYDLDAELWPWRITDEKRVYHLWSYFFTLFQTQLALFSNILWK